MLVSFIKFGSYVAEYSGLIMIQKDGAWPHPEKDGVEIRYEREAKGNDIQTHDLGLVCGALPRSSFNFEGVTQGWIGVI